MRFLASHFSITGDAIDPLGGTCTDTACPRCHLKVPRMLAIRDKMAISIFGSPSSGKTYFLASMVHQMAREFARLGLQVDEVDPEANAVLNEYQFRMFHQPPGRKVVLLKTDTGGQWYNEVVVDGMPKQLPKPFLYRVEQVAETAEKSLGWVVSVYDNAGESFEPGGDSEDNPVTRHMAQADGLLFVYDPTQEVSFCAACREKSDDPQWKEPRITAQATLFSEAMNRVRNYRGLLPTDRIDMPLIVVLQKFDAWSFLLDSSDLPTYLSETKQEEGRLNYNAEAVESVSRSCRSMLQKYAPEVLARIEGACRPDNVTFIPVAATGGPPSVAEEDFPEDEVTVGAKYFRAGDIKPSWVEVPLLQLLHASSRRVAR